MGGEISTAKARIKTGTYTGDGNATQAITGVGFKPTVVWVFMNLAVSGYWYFKTDQMGGTNSVRDSGTSDYNTDYIRTLDDDGFTVGTSGGVNTLDRIYFFVAMRD